MKEPVVESLEALCLTVATSSSLECFMRMGESGVRLLLHARYAA
jgi:hypothetical protein